MTERKQLKKKLAKMYKHKSDLPRLINCSIAFGDNYYTKDDLVDVEKQIKEVEKQIADIDSITPTQP